MSEQEKSPIIKHENPILASTSIILQNPAPSRKFDPEDIIESDTALSLKEFSKPTVDFRVELDKTSKGDSYEISDALNRLYTTSDKSLTFEIRYNSSIKSDPKVRTILVSPNFLHQPFARCSYHLKGDNTTFKHHVVRHKDATAEYVGTATGIRYSERLAILFPLDDSGRKTISLDFACLTSCHKIKKLKLALVFTLENHEGGKIEGRRIFHVQISKNFKRDLEVAEKGYTLKRPPEAVEEAPAKLAQPESQPSTSSSRGKTKSTEKKPGFVTVSLNLEMPQDAAQDFLNYTKQFFEAKLYMTGKQSEQNNFRPCLDEIQKHLEKLRKENEKTD